MKNNLPKFGEAQVRAASVEYFKGDELAADVWMKKYCLKDESNYYELSPVDMHKRLAREFARIENKYPNSLGETEIFETLDGFKRIVPQGSPMSGIGNDLQIVSLSNCYVIGNDGESDSYGGIFKIDQEIAQLEKRRGGVGTDLSFVRPTGSPVNNSAITSTGVVPFMERYSNTTKEVAQDGRRGALMLSIDVHHPDSEKFIDAKLQQGKVTGANISVKLSDKFMEAALSNKNFTQQYPLYKENPKVKIESDANRIWKKIIHNAWKSAEPGILFWDKIKNESIPDCYPEHGFSTTSTNPCIVGDSIIATADGRNGVSIKQLAEEGKDVPVYSKDENGQVQIKWGRNPRLTGKKKEVWKLTLDDNSEFIATPDHIMYLKDGTKIKLKDLKPGNSLSSFYSFISNKNYRQISECGQQMSGGRFRNRRQYRLIYEFFNGTKTEYKQFAIHHKDFNSKNDAIENLQLMPLSEHIKYHSDLIKGANNPYHKFTDEQKFKFASHPGEKNGRYIKVTNDELLEHGKKIYEKNGILTASLWKKYAKENNLPIYLANDFRFKTFVNFKNQVVDNHKVISVEFFGYDDVYNITVDDNHNYIVITSKDDENYVTSGGICVKNCGEIPLCPYDSCRLLAVNLFGYVINPFKSNASFDLNLFKSDVRIAMRLMDDIVDLEIEKLEKIIEKIKSDPESEFIKQYELVLWEKILEKTIQGRRTGLGITGLGDMIAALGFRYGTDEANSFIEEIQKTLKLIAYRTSVEMARERGSFPIYDSSKEEKNPFILRIKEEDPELYDLMKTYGRRNIALLTIAPTGSVSILTQTTSGCEPVFSPFYTRRRKINPQEKGVRVDFVDVDGISWTEYPVFHHKFVDWLRVNNYSIKEVLTLNKDEINKIVKLSPYYKATSNDVDWVKKVEMQGLLQKHVDHSISVTVNLPNYIDEETVSKVYETGWRVGCKGITVYRDGSRDGVLVTEDKKKTIEKENIFKESMAPKRPRRLKGEIHHFRNDSEKWIAVVGILKDRPYEIFTGRYANGLSHLPSYLKECEIIKVVYEDETGEKRKRYDIEYVDKDGNKQLATGLSHKFNPDYWNYAKLISGVLRHGMPLVYVYELVNSLNLHDDNLNTWKNGIIRVIKRYIKDGETVSGAKCPSCGSTHLEFKEGCLTCISCGNSKCS